MPNSLEKRINRLCDIVGRTPDQLQRSGDWVLGLAGDIYRDAGHLADDLMEDICSDAIESDEYRKMCEGMVKLEFFSNETIRQNYQAEIHALFRTAWMMKVIEAAKANVYTFRKYGPQFLEILTLAYTSSYDSTVEQMAETMRMSPQNFYKKKKYATILFAYEFERLINALTLSREPVGWHGEQMTLEDYMN